MSSYCQKCGTISARTIHLCKDENVNRITELEKENARLVEALDVARETLDILAYPVLFTINIREGVSHDYESYEICRPAKEALTKISSTLNPDGEGSDNNNENKRN